MDIKELQDLLEKEKWTVAQLQACEVDYFNEWDQLIKGIPSDELIEAKQLCDEYFENKK